MNMPTITFDYLAKLTQRAWRFAQHEWPQLPRGPMPVFELKTEDDRKKQGIGYPMAEMKDLDHADVALRVIYEVSIFATLMRGAPPEQVAATFETLVDRFTASPVAASDQSTKH